MVRIFGAVLGLWVPVASAFAQDAEAIEGVIANQLQAFIARDVQSAWTYASPNIQRLFGDAQNFGTMVERGYPMVWNNVDTQFLALREIAGNFWQQVMIRDVNGNLHLLEYQMIETPDGWQINGVQLLPSPDVGA